MIPLLLLRLDSFLCFLCFLLLFFLMFLRNEEGQDRWDGRRLQSKVKEQSFLPLFSFSPSSLHLSFFVEGKVIFWDFVPLLLLFGFLLGGLSFLTFFFSALSVLCLASSYLRFLLSRVFSFSSNAKVSEFCCVWAALLSSLCTCLPFFGLPLLLFLFLFSLS